MVKLLTILLCLFSVTRAARAETIVTAAESNQKKQGEEGNHTRYHPTNDSANVTVTTSFAFWRVKGKNNTL